MTARIIAALALLVACSTACDVRPFPTRARLVTGEAQRLGAGHVQTWALLDRHASPIALGVSLSDAALGQIEAGPPLSITLALPASMAGAVFDHVELYASPLPHEPPGLLDRPHLDVRFSVLGARERDAIDDSSRALRVPALDLLPRGNILLPRLIPRVGAYWIDPAAPVLHGQPFDAVLLHGFYDGALVALEPKVSLEWLRRRQRFARAIEQPRQFARAGHYPRRFAVRYDAGPREYRISLEDLVRRR